MKSASKEPAEKAPSKFAHVSIEERNVGIYRMLVAHERYRSFSQIRGQAFETYSRQLKTLWMLLVEIYAVAPLELVFYFLTMTLLSTTKAVEMALMSRTLQIVEHAIQEQKAVPINEIGWSISLIVSWSVMSAGIMLLRNKKWRAARGRIADHFRLKILQADLSRELSSGDEEKMTGKIQHGEIFSIVEDVSSRISYIVSAASQFAVITQIATNAGGPLFALACLARPLMTMATASSIWDLAWFAYRVHEDTLRLSALRRLGDTYYQQDVISGNLVGWIIDEYRRIRQRTGYVQEDHPASLYADTTGDFFKQALDKVLDNLPWIYSVAYSMLYPQLCSLTGIAVMQSSSSQLRMLLDTVLGRYGDSSWKEKLIRLEELYAKEGTKSEVEEKDNYPHEKSDPLGMAFEIRRVNTSSCDDRPPLTPPSRDVNFSYPSSQKKEGSLSSVNLTIPAGSVVVLVGANGSGKSTLIRLLCRLYDPTSGSVLIDGRPSTSYRVNSLRESSVLLCQDHHVFPLSLAENIGLGYPPLMHDMDLVKDAAEKGGARAFIEKLDDGFDTILDPHLGAMMNKVDDIPDHPLHAEKKKVKKRADISGGERQRVVASRAFMRMHSNKIRFVAVDEPTSALDSEGELKLFTRLLEEREGKTMIFVTHRFGYLTKHADMIVCMKDGRVEEVGTHSQLISKEDGEYAKLYNIQANAFLADADATSAQ